MSKPKLTGPRPDWLKVRIRSNDTFDDVNRMINDLSLHTVCQEARCPNIFECWSEGTATFMILGDICTRHCGFCAVGKGKPVALDPDGKVMARYPATVGSEHDPLPIGTWKINGVSWNPSFAYNPELFWDSEPTDEKAKLPPGPNGPVGVVWIDLSKPHYGIHGTPEPSTIGKTQSHGCIRLTNWDAAELAQMVSPGLPAPARAVHR